MGKKDSNRVKIIDKCSLLEDEVKWDYFKDNYRCKAYLNLSIDGDNSFLLPVQLWVNNSLLGYQINIEHLLLPFHWPELEDGPKKLYRKNLTREQLDTWKNKNGFPVITFKEKYNWPDFVLNSCKTLNEIDQEQTVKKEPSTILANRNNLGSFLPVENEFRKTYEAIKNSGINKTEKIKEIVALSAYISAELYSKESAEVQLFGEGEDVPDYLVRREGRSEGIEITDIVKAAQQSMQTALSKPISVSEVLNEGRMPVYDVARSFSKASPNIVTEKNIHQMDALFTSQDYQNIDCYNVWSLGNEGIKHFIDQVIKKTKRLKEYKHNFDFTTLVAVWRWNVDFDEPVAARLGFFLSRGFPSQNNSYWNLSYRFNQIAVVSVHAHHQDRSRVTIFKEDGFFYRDLDFRFDLPMHYGKWPDD